MIHKRVNYCPWSSDTAIHIRVKYRPWPSDTAKLLSLAERYHDIYEGDRNKICIHLDLIPNIIVKIGEMSTKGKALSKPCL